MRRSLIEQSGHLPLTIVRKTRKWGDLPGRPNNIITDGDLLSDFDRL